MTYTKPEVLLLGRAVDAVQSQLKDDQQYDSSAEQSASAYQADE
jgi:hypothetical protein